MHVGKASNANPTSFHACMAWGSTICICEMSVWCWEALWLKATWMDTCDIEMALKSKSYIFDLDHVKLSLEIFFFLSCLIESVFHQLSGSTLFFVRNTHQKPANLMFCLISPVAKSPEGQSSQSSTAISQHIKLGPQHGVAFYLSSLSEITKFVWNWGPQQYILKVRSRRQTLSKFCLVRF